MHAFSVAQLSLVGYSTLYRTDSVLIHCLTLFLLLTWMALERKGFKLQKNGSQTQLALRTCETVCKVRKTSKARKSSTPNFLLTSAPVSLHSWQDVMSSLL